MKQLDCQAIIFDIDVVAARLSDIQAVTDHVDPDQEGACIHVTVL